MRSSAREATHIGSMACREPSAAAPSRASPVMHLARGQFAWRTEPSRCSPRHMSSSSASGVKLPATRRSPAKASIGTCSRVQCQSCPQASPIPRTASRGQPGAKCSTVSVPSVLRPGRRCNPCFACLAMPSPSLGRTSQGRKACLAFKALSNPSFNRSANGMAPCPRGSACLSSASRARHHAAVARLTLR